MAENFDGDDTKNEKKSLDEQTKNEKEHHIDILLQKKGPKIVDTEILITNTQKRIWAALTKGYQYESVFDESDKLLRKFVSSRVHMIVLYVDLVGSTSMTLSLPEDKVAIIISSFAQEMASIITQHEGYVLKFVGDAVIGFFIAEATALLAADNAVNCAKSMLKVIDKGINPILNQYDYPELMVKIGMDYGENIIVRYGADEKNAHVDILGPAMNIAAKIQNMAKPNRILIGEDVYNRLHPSLKKSFEKIVWSKNQWKYQDRETGKLYPVYAYVG